ncbi:Ubiquitin carboxyl-terminal hydrolase [Carpediemonas membranifera]|uniref:ubiquitinyl hydrolase 1 n=1 Tax=Carpediemonas membranifera TaxID=201153 RepID=A0A8J6AUX8_9EUKA|nr:Ubiquitin carboxyl-terminal hydrolase [Carpediemonas membranifera]|eukprot:KAG9393125.1 Ubiquitin carboxyl-terminal hydrolase [Carpediemonas membranifera]
MAKGKKKASEPHADTLTTIKKPKPLVFILGETTNGDATLNKAPKHVRAVQHFVPPSYMLYPHNSLLKLAKWDNGLRANGLVNVDSTSYMNAGLQALLAIPMFAQYLRKKTHSTTHSPLEWCPFCTMEKYAANVLYDRKDGQRPRALDPMSLRTNLRHLSSEFPLHQEHDTRAFVQTLLAKMDEADLRSSGNDPRELPDKVEHTTALGQMFGQWVVRTEACPLCPCQAHSCSYATALPVAMERRHETLEQALEAMTSPRPLGEERQCDHCRATGAPVSKAVIAQAPEVLVIPLDYNGPKNAKKRRAPTLPLSLSLTACMAPQLREGAGTAYSYDLVSVVRREKAGGGHYWCQARHSQQWWKLDDGAVSKIPSVNDVQAMNGACMLVYCRRVTVPVRDSAEAELRVAVKGSRFQHRAKAAHEEEEEKEAEVEDVDMDAPPSPAVVVEGHVPHPTAPAAVPGDRVDLAIPVPVAPERWTKDEYNVEYDKPKERKLRKNMKNALAYPTVGSKKKPTSSVFRAVQQGRVNARPIKKRRRDKGARDSRDAAEGQLYSVVRAAPPE